MSNDKSTGRPTQNPETKIAQDIFVRDRGAQRETPLDEFLTHIKEEANSNVENDKLKR